MVFEYFFKLRDGATQQYLVLHVSIPPPPPPPPGCHFVVVFWIGNQFRPCQAGNFNTVSMQYRLNLFMQIFSYVVLCQKDHYLSFLIGGWTEYSHTYTLCQSARIEIRRSWASDLQGQGKTERVNMQLWLVGAGFLYLSLPVGKWRIYLKSLSFCGKIRYYINFKKSAVSAFDFSSSAHLLM